MSKRAEAKLRKLRNTAYHEAGHAVAAIKLGYELVRVTIKPDREWYGRIELTQSSVYPPMENLDEWKAWVTDQCLIRFAGAVAEKRFAGRWRWSGAEDDRKQVLSLCQYAVSPEFEEAGDHARHLKERDRFYQGFLRHTQDWVAIPENWRSIETVAGALLERETLTANEVKELLMVAN